MADSEENVANQEIDEKPENPEIETKPATAVVPENTESVEITKNDETEAPHTAPEVEKQTEIQFYGQNFHQLIDPEPSVASLFKLQMTRCVERTVQYHSLIREADKLIRAEQASADALGKLGMEFNDTKLKNLTEIASMRTIAAMKLDDGLLQAKTRLQTLNIAIRAVNESEVEHEQAIITHLKNADSGRVIAARGRAHQTRLEALVSAAQLSSFQVEFKNALGNYLTTVSPELNFEQVDVQNLNKKANQLNTQVMEALQATHYSLGANSNGPPRGWLNYRTRGLPFSQWQRIFFFIQDCHLMKQAKDEINANVFLDFKGCTIEDCQVDDRANTFVVRAPSGNYYFQGESFESAIAWRVTIESLITASKQSENNPEEMSPEMAEQVTRGRSSSMGDGWMSNITGNLKSAFTNFKSSATTAVDQLEQKLAKIDSPSNSVVDPSLGRPEIDPAEMENISWSIPEKNANAKDIEGKNLECRFLGCRKSNLSEGETICGQIKQLRTQYQVPTPPLCGLVVNSSQVAIHPSDQAENAVLGNLIKLIPLEGDLSGLLVDRDDHAQVWLLQGLDLTARLGEILQPKENA